MTRFINLTLAPVHIHCEDREVVIRPDPSGPARVSELVVDACTMDSVRVRTVGIGDIHGLPPPQAGTVYIVPAAVADAARRDDVLTPDMEDAIRSETGRVIAVRGLRRALWGKV